MQKTVEFIVQIAISAESKEGFEKCIKDIKDMNFPLDTIGTSTKYGVYQYKTINTRIKK